MARSPPLVGAEHRRLELLLGHGLHGLQGEAHLLAHGAQPGPDGTGVGDPRAASSCSSSSMSTLLSITDICTSADFHRSPPKLRFCRSPTAGHAGRLPSDRRYTNDRPPYQEALPLCVVLLTERGYARPGTITPVRPAQTTPAAEGRRARHRGRRRPVSARSTVGPRPTPAPKAATSSSSHPPSGPTATTGVVQGRGDRRPDGPVSAPPRTNSPRPSSVWSPGSTSGIQSWRHWAADSRTTRRSRSTARTARARPPTRTTDRLDAERHDAVDTRAR